MGTEKKARAEQESGVLPTRQAAEVEGTSLLQGQQACWQDLEIYRGGVDGAFWQEEVSEGGNA